MLTNKKAKKNLLHSQTTHLTDNTLIVAKTKRATETAWFTVVRNAKVGEQHTKMLGTWINNQDFKSDIVSVTGAQMKEQKFHHANLFAATNLPSFVTSQEPGNHSTHKN
jgi:hypothetical protein